eukprot:3855400-Pyramimonas_sp.AAC.1
MSGCPPFPGLPSPRLRHLLIPECVPSLPPGLPKSVPRPRHTHTAQDTQSWLGTAQRRHSMAKICSRQLQAG